MAKMDEVMNVAIKEIVKHCKTQEDFIELFKQLKQRGLEAAVSGELTDRLGYDKNARGGQSKSNRRNGYSSKIIQTSQAEMEISVPRDRQGNFEPKIIPKYQTHFD